MTEQHQCKSCRYWQSPDEKVGTCKELALADGLHHWGVYLLTSDGELDDKDTYRRVMTPATFGCVHYVDRWDGKEDIGAYHRRTRTGDYGPGGQWSGEPGMPYGG